MVSLTVPSFVAIQRISSLPIVKSGLDKATDIYVKVKKSNRLIQWSLQTAEVTVTIAIDLSKPTIVLLDGPIHLIDEILCKSLDMVEEAVPIIKQEPDQIYLEAKNYVSSVMEPVLKRADSVKELSIQSAIIYSNKAAESLDNVLTVADQYVDKYLPEINPSADNPSAVGEDVVDHQLDALRDYGFSVAPRNQIEKTIRHVNRSSRTLKRRLTQRTLYEARALKNQGMNLIQALVQMTDLLARDPKAFIQKMKDLWIYLSEDEPENQAPPQNLEQLIVMLTREGARRFVHIANFISYTAVKIPEYVNTIFSYAIHKYTEYVQSLNITSKGIKRHAEILKHTIHDIFDQFFNLIKPLINSSQEVRIPLHISSGSSHVAVCCSTKSTKKTGPKSPPSTSEDGQANGGVVAQN